MIGLDTNVLVRYITSDDHRQTAMAARLIEGLSEASPGYITLVTLVELYWVLESAYQFTRSQLVEVFQIIIATENFKIDRVSVVASAVRQYSESKADFSDCLIERLSTAAGCQNTMTFDKAAAKTAGMLLIRFAH
jgi:predicted nucleic-acid-binding protein